MKRVTLGKEVMRCCRWKNRKRGVGGEVQLRNCGCLGLDRQELVP